MNTDCINELNEALREGYNTIRFDDIMFKWIAYDRENTEHKITLDYYYPLDLRYWYNINKVLRDMTD